MTQGRPGTWTAQAAWSGRGGGAQTPTGSSPGASDLARTAPDSGRVAGDNGQCGRGSGHKGHCERDRKYAVKGIQGSGEQQRRTIPPQFSFGGPSIYRFATRVQRECRHNVAMQEMGCGNRNAEDTRIVTRHGQISTQEGEEASPTKNRHRSDRMNAWCTRLWYKHDNLSARVCSKLHMSTP